MSGLSDEQWHRIFEGVADRAPEAFKDVDLPISIYVLNDDGTKTTIYEQKGKNDDSASDH